MTIIRTVALLCLLVACGPKANPDTPKISQKPETPRTSEDSASSPVLIPTALEGDPMATTIHRLSNGLTVYISTDRTTPSITSWIAIRAGSRNDPADSTGLAHYLEHMLFKGTSSLGSLDFAKEKPHLDRIAVLYDELRVASTPEERSKLLAEIDKETQASSAYSVPNEFDNLYASLGIDGVNAFTGDDQTIYIANVPSNRFTTWATVEGERFANPQFRLFYPELESVYEEKNRSLDSPGSRIFQALATGLFPNHPYGTQPTIGLTEHLKTPAYADMVAYFDAWYRPNNMAIILAGDIDPESALPVLEAKFGGLAPKALPELPASSVEPIATRTDIEIKAPGEQAVYLAWPTVQAGHEDETALRVMDLVTDNSATGLINIDLLLEQKLPAARSEGQQQAEAGLWLLNGTARDGQSLDEVESLLMSVVAALKSGSFTQEDLRAIVLNSEIREKRSLESRSSRTSRMADAFISQRAWSEVVAAPERLRSVTRDDVIRVANKYLGDAPVVVKRVNGKFTAEKVPKPSITAIEIESSRQSVYGKAIKALPVEALSPQWLKDGEHYFASKTSAGDAIAVHNDRNDLFTIRYDFEMGEKQEPLLCFALELVGVSGSGEMSAAALQKTLYGLGTTISFSCDANETSITVSGIDHNMEKSLELLKSWLDKPMLGTDSLTKLVANIVSRRKDAMGEPQIVARALSAYAFFGKESRYLKVASNKTLKKTSQTSFLKLAKALPQYSHRTSYFGPRAADVIKSISLGAGTKAPKKRPPLRYRRVKLSTLFFVDQETAQAQVRFTFPAAELPAEDRMKARLFSQYVGGGMGALVFQEIREARGLAYSAWASYWSTQRTGDESSVVGGLGTQADKTIEAVSTLIGLLAPLAVEDNRYLTTVTALDAEFRQSRVDPRERAATVYSWFDLGMTNDPGPAEYRALHATKGDAMEKFANARTSLPPIIAITGDSKRIDLKELSKAAKIAKIKVLAVSKLFGY